jgi:hypothetical protein
VVAHEYEVPAPVTIVDGYSLTAEPIGVFPHGAAILPRERRLS